MAKLTEQRRKKDELSVITKKEKGKTPAHMLATSKTANGILSHDTCKNNRLILSKREHLSHHHNFISEKYSLIVTRLLLFQMHKNMKGCIG